MNVVEIPVVTTLPSDPQRVLDRMKNLEPKTVIVIGFDKDGGFCFQSSTPDGGEVLWLMELAKHKLMKIGAGE
jgi:hypothetical protein